MPLPRRFHGDHQFREGEGQAERGLSEVETPLRPDLVPQVLLTDGKSIDSVNSL